jgi:hypothetical protein
MTNFWDALEQVDQSCTEYKSEYRLYYDENTGEPLFYSAEQPKGTFIWVGTEDFNAHRFDIKIKDGKITHLKPGIGKLVPSNEKEGTETDSSDVSLVSSNTNTYWKNKTYELD